VTPSGSELARARVRGDHEVDEFRQRHSRLPAARTAVPRNASPLDQ
jgi:hypothetical protein